MLKPSEEIGLRQILDNLLDLDLFSLADTVTKKLYETSNRKEAINAIISCLEKPSDLLKRQRVRKKVLFSYLQQVKPFVSPECSKLDLVQMCLEEWKSSETCQVSDYETVSTLVQKEDWLVAMGLQFSEWFFSIYNNLKDFGPEHFWSDCKLIGELQTTSDKKEVAVIGDNTVTGFLVSLIVNDKFFFHANNSQDSIISEKDAHGLVRILVSGVVHKFDNCIGLFDSAFGLIRNPAFDNNWKIKWIHMKIHITNGRDPYSLPNSCNSICQTNNN